VLEFVEVRGSQASKDLAKIIQKLCAELNIKDKLFDITGDNASNNSTLCHSLYTSLRRQYNNKVNRISTPQMRFHGRGSWIRYLDHIIALIVGDVLSDLKAGSVKEAKRALDS
jgi:hypothetical protein